MARSNDLNHLLRLRVAIILELTPSEEYNSSNLDEMKLAG